MSITVITPANSRALTSASAVSLEVPTLAAERVASLIASASEAVRQHCDRIFERQQYLEMRAGFGEATMMVRERPVADAPSTVIEFDDEALDDWAVKDAKYGEFYRGGGFISTARIRTDIESRPIADSEEERYGVTYWAGYLVPDDNRTGTTFSAAALDNSFNDTASSFPLLVPGDRFTVTGGTNAGTYTVVSRTASKLVVSGGTLVNEVAGTSKTFGFRNLPEHIERAVIETIRTWTPRRDPSVTSRSVSKLSVSYGQGGASDMLPDRAIGLLRNEGRW